MLFDIPQTGTTNWSTTSKNYSRHDIFHEQLLNAKIFASCYCRIRIGVQTLRSAKQIVHDESCLSPPFPVSIKCRGTRDPLPPGWHSVLVWSPMLSPQVTRCHRCCAGVAKPSLKEKHWGRAHQKKKFVLRWIRVFVPFFPNDFFEPWRDRGNSRFSPSNNHIKSRLLSNFAY